MKKHDSSSQYTVAPGKTDRSTNCRRTAMTLARYLLSKDVSRMAMTPFIPYAQRRRAHAVPRCAAANGEPVSE